MHSHRIPPPVPATLGVGPFNKSKARPGSAYEPSKTTAAWQAKSAAPYCALEPETRVPLASSNPVWMRPSGPWVPEEGRGRRTWANPPCPGADDPVALDEDTRTRPTEGDPGLSGDDERTAMSSTPPWDPATLPPKVQAVNTTSGSPTGEERTEE